MSSSEVSAVAGIRCPVAPVPPARNVATLSYRLGRMIVAPARMLASTRPATSTSGSPWL
jgi:hypothetical protein